VQSGRRVEVRRAVLGAAAARAAASDAHEAGIEAERPRGGRGQEIAVGGIRCPPAHDGDHNVAGALNDHASTLPGWHTGGSARGAPMTLIDNAVYVDGHRLATPASLDETYEVLKASGGFAWIGMYRPTEPELRSVAEEFELHHLSIEDALTGHQRSKLERFDDVLFVVLRPARYIDSEERVEFGELHVFVGPDFVFTIRHAESPNLAMVRARMEVAPGLLAFGPESVLYAIFDQVVDEYSPVIAGLENDIDEIEDQLFDGDQTVARRIYDLSREVIEFQRATQPLIGMLEALKRGFTKYNVDVELQHHLDDVLDHALRIVERGGAFRQILDNALIVHSTLVTQRQNDETRRLSETSVAQSEEVKKISAWAAILFAPTLVGTVYGMNFVNMPELNWEYGYPFAVGLMLAGGLALWGVFKRNNWL
jgi:magnesium transporter